MKVYGMKKWKMFEGLMQRDEMGRRIDSLMVSSDNTKRSR